MKYQRHYMNFGLRGVTLCPVDNEDAIEATLDALNGFDAVADEQMRRDQQSEHPAIAQAIRENF